MKSRQWQRCVALGVAAFWLAAVPAVAAENNTAITDVRVGIHGSKTRIVLDVTSPAKFSFATAATGNAVFIELPGVRWAAPKFGAAHNRGVLTDFRFGASPGGGGQLSLLTTQPVRISQKFLLPPSGNRGYRIVMDLVADETALGGQQVAAGSGSLGSPNQFEPGAQPLNRPQGRSAGSPIAPSPVEIAQVQFPRRTQSTAFPGGLHSGAVAQQQPIPGAPQMHQQPMMAGTSPFYVRGGLGIGLAAAAENKGAANSNTLDTEAGLYMSGALGLDLRNGFRVEGEMLFASNTAQSLIGNAAGTGTNTGNVEGEVDNLSFMANVAYDLPNQTRLTPFVFGGAGISGIILDQIKVNDSKIYDDIDWVLSLQAGAGVNFAVDDRLSIEALYRYLETATPEFSDAGGNPFESEYSAHHLTVGARYKF